jgi:hypothetical protein
VIGLLTLRLYLVWSKLFLYIQFVQRTEHQVASVEQRRIPNQLFKAHNVVIHVFMPNFVELNLEVQGYVLQKCDEMNDI